MKQYKELVEYVMKNGIDKSDRTGVGTRSIFGYSTRYNLSLGFPLVTLKKTFFKGLVYELLWFLKGDTNIKYLTDNNVHIWDEWADENGDLGPIYGKQWVNWESNGKIINQIDNIINEIKTNPDSRRLIVNAWNVADIDDMALPPCHLLFQFYVVNGKLSCHLYQRSADLFLGVPFNIASYSLLTHMIAHICNLEVGDFVHTIGDAHIYHNHFKQVEEMLSRNPLPLPKLIIKRKVDSIYDFKYEDFEICGYESHPTIKAPVAI